MRTCVTHCALQQKNVAQMKNYKLTLQNRCHFYFYQFFLSNSVNSSSLFEFLTLHIHSGIDGRDFREFLCALHNFATKTLQKHSVVSYSYQKNLPTKLTTNKPKTTQRIQIKLIWQQQNVLKMIKNDKTAHIRTFIFFF